LERGFLKKQSHENEVVASFHSWDETVSNAVLTVAEE
jgi:hypothetical protein